MKPKLPPAPPSSPLTGTVRIDLKRKRPKRGASPREAATPELPRKREAIPVKKIDTDGKELFFELFESVYDGILITDLNGFILRFNERAREYFQFEDDVVGNLRIIDVVSGADDGTLDWIRTSLRDERRVWIDCICKCIDGTGFPAEVTINQIHFSEKSELCFFVRNVTVRKQTEEALRKAQEQLVNVAHKAGMAEIATGVLHDVGNLLNTLNVSTGVIRTVMESNSIKGLAMANRLVQENLDSLGAFLTDDDRGKQLPEVYFRVGDVLQAEWNKIRKESDRLQRTIDVTKEVIKAQQDNAKLGQLFEELDVDEVIGEAIALQQSEISNHSVTIERKCEPDLVFVSQRAKLIFILVNLIRNAVDAVKGNEEGSRRLYIQGFEDEEGINITVADNGTGMPEEVLDQIFTHGFTTKATGHGFGLHICANLMREIGGQIVAESEGDGMGARFTLLFPTDLADDEGGDG